MRCKVLFRILALLILVSPLFALSQEGNIKTFKINLPENKVSNSLYDEITLIDSRNTRTNLGLVQTGLLNRAAFVQPLKSMNQYVKEILAALNPSMAGHGHLLLQFRHFAFAEKTGFASEHGYFYFKANLFKDSLNRFYPISSIDTILVVSAMDVTDKNLNQGSAMLINFISSGLSLAPKPDAVALSNYQLDHMDDIEKETIPLYTAAALKEGIYNSYDAFKHQQPDDDVKEIKMSGSQVAALYLADKKGRKRKVSSARVYAFVNEGHPYIATHYGFYPLTKEDNEFYFTGKVDAVGRSENIATASIFFGLIGYAVASMGGREIVRMKIDHLTGAFVPDQADIVVDSPASRGN